MAGGHDDKSIGVLWSDGRTDQGGGDGPERGPPVAARHPAGVREHHQAGRGAGGEHSRGGLTLVVGGRGNK